MPTDPQAQPVDRRLLDRLGTRLDEALPGAVALRRALHEHPDLSGDEEGTVERVLDALPRGIAVERVADTGAVARVGPPGEPIAVRAELDALPIGEATGHRHASTRPGVMHACGHDVHLAALVALAHAVAAEPDAPPLLAVLQPREETYPSGAQDITADGVLARHAARAIIGAHVQPLLAPGEVASTPGPVNAAADEFTIVVRGHGGHAAYPHRTRDPVLALAHIVVALQQIPARSVDPMAPVVLGVSTLQAGTAPNAVPETATASGVLRTMNDEDREHLRERLRAVAAGTAQAHECTVEVTIEAGEPVLRNDPRLAAATADALPALGLRPAPGLRSCGADDFAHYAPHLPALMVFVGVDGPAGLHSPAFLPPDDTVRHTAYAMLAGFVAAHSTAS